MKQNSIGKVIFNTPRKHMSTVDMFAFRHAALSYFFPKTLFGMEITKMFNLRNIYVKCSRYNIFKIFHLLAQMKQI